MFKNAKRKYYYLIRVYIKKFILIFERIIPYPKFIILKYNQVFPLYKSAISVFSFLLLFFVSCNENNTIKPDFNNQTLYFNGEILTMQNNEAEYAEAIVEEDGIIVFVGLLAEAENEFPKANKIDLKGKTLLPGFIDPHSHFGTVSNTAGQVDLNPKPVGDVETIADILEKIKKYKTDNNIPDGEWIFGWGYDNSQLKEQRHPNNKEIDSVLPNNPVYLQHASGHMGVANSMALSEMEVSTKTQNPEGENIARHPNSNEPNGLVQETAMYPFVRNMLEILTSHQEKNFETTQDYYASNGITTAHDGMIDRATIAFYQEQGKKGKFKIDLVALAGYADLDENLKDKSIPFKTYENGFKVQGTKIIADGSPQGKTAFFSEAYLTEVPSCIHDCKGLPTINQEEMNQLFLTAYEKNNQLYIHCNGDASIDMIITAHEHACKKLNQALDKDRRTIPIHSQFVRLEQLETFKKYNFAPSFFTNHAYFWGDEHLLNLGKERADFLSPIATADKLGLKYTNHSDATVTPISPVFTI